MAGSGMVRTILIVGGTTVVAAVAGGMVAVPPLPAGAAPGTAPTPVTSTPVTSATPVPEPTRAPVDWDTLSEKEEAALFEGQNAQGTALALVQETYPDDFAYG
ncbi:hypothetical protein K2F54_04430 [Cryobacterium sp. 1639]|uniref:hypothetical protein n=1 Tax=Cryobacterium inferilacus TaxID=2866629 RepID=UPI001C73E0BE|nr:hypothetical protein [Cryobacterium sp. 1639]MBX0299221.1 hypothetical protein [Cryobacterium sp. 1639]